MKRSHKSISFLHRFTLIEVLVSVAVLVIMMGFLFQFIAGAQRIWAVTNSQSVQSANANTVFGFLIEDLGNVKSGDEASNGHGYYPTMESSSDNLSELLLVTNSHTAVRYVFKDNTLYRKECSFPEDKSYLIQNDVTIPRKTWNSKNEIEYEDVDYAFVFSIGGVPKKGLKDNSGTLEAGTFTPQGDDCYEFTADGNSYTSATEAVKALYYESLATEDITTDESNILCENLNELQVIWPNPESVSKGSFIYQPAPALIYVLLETTSPTQYQGYVKSSSDNNLTFSKLIHAGGN